jgi:transcriptional regulator GlxA family with amidase domain
MGKRRLAILGYDGVAAINLVGPLEAFSNARGPDETGKEVACYDVSVMGCTGAQFVSDTGVVFCASERNDDHEEPFDTIIIPGGTGLRSAETCAAVAEWIKIHADSSRRVASICTGIYALASTGLVDGKRITTHWEHAREVAARFPKVRVEESALFLKDGKFYSSAGATAGIDLSLALIAEDLGQPHALRVARRLLVYLVRDGGQEQYSEPAKFEPNSEFAHSQINGGRMQKLLDWVAKHLGDELKLVKLAKRAGLTKDDFIGQFSQTFGVPPGLFVKNLRFNEARRRLARGEPAVDVAKALGFQETYFIQEFRRRYGALPNEYQRRFGAISRSDDSAQPATASFPSSDRQTRTERQTPYQRPKIVSFTRCLRARPANPELQSASAH